MIPKEFSRAFVLGLGIIFIQDYKHNPSILQVPKIKKKKLTIYKKFIL